ncbi:MAG: DHA2 family efflux MFS transporter permease subunit [Caulobacteraceae bacterium]|nr:DHA2 family efflux MFS transporter permease subunit [Caulobacteraceae bacterium]
MAPAEDIANRIPITFGLMVATVMTTLDSTIANVALPHMQGSFSASQDQMTWVLTSYVVAAALMTPLSGWLTARIGQRRMVLLAIGGFTAASMLCGSASSLAEMVVVRLLQGLCGAVMIPVSQAVMLDLFPPRQLSQAMAVWGAGTALGPMLGPVIGGWLTEDLSWRWVFYINLPVGIGAMVVLALFMSRDRPRQAPRLDIVGFGALALFIGGLQLALDRGPRLDWFASPEVWTEAIASGLGLYLFIVQMLAARRPFFERSLFRDRNFVTSNIFSIVVSLVVFSTIALQPPLLQQLLGYPVFSAGLIMAPRSVFSLCSMLGVGQLAMRVDNRLLLAGGLALTAMAMLQMSRFDLSMTSQPFLVASIMQGVSTGFLFVPMNTLAFVTLAGRLRGDAAAFSSMTRSLGQSVGISMVEAIYTNQAAVAHADLAGQVHASSPVFAAGMAARASPLSLGGLAGLNGEITRQAAMIGYVDVYYLMFLTTVAVMPLVFMLRLPRRGAPLLVETIGE